MFLTRAKGTVSYCQNRLSFFSDDDRIRIRNDDLEKKENSPAVCILVCNPRVSSRRRLEDASLVRGAIG